MAEGGLVAVVANPAAGRGKAGRLIGKVDARLRDLGVEHEIRVSESAADLERIARDAGERGAGIVAALGGDGTVGIVANGILGTGAALATLPAGTADDFAKGIGAGKLQTAISLLVAPRIRDVDVVRVTAGAETRHFVNIAGTGFDSEVEQVARDMRLDLGARGTYMVATLKTLSRFVPASFRLQVDDQSMDLEAMLVVVGNGCAYGGGMRVFPTASVVDGELDVCVVSAMSKGAFVRAFPKVYFGKHATHPNVTMLQGKGVKLEADRRMLVYGDGERIGPLPAVFDVVPSALPVVVGPDAKAIPA